MSGRQNAGEPPPRLLSPDIIYHRQFALISPGWAAEKVNAGHPIPIINDDGRKNFLAPVL